MELSVVVGLPVVLGFVLTTVLILIWIERKFLGHIQMRLGPMRTGFHGWLQSPADAVKLLVKEDLVPASADRWVFEAAPIIVFVPVLLVFVTIPFTRDLVLKNLDMGLFYIVAVSSISIVGLVMAGWASDNKYALLGGVRAAAQLVSYELPLVLSILGVVIIARSLSLVTIVTSQDPLPYVFLQPVGLTVFLLAGLAEVSRTPFDIPVAESEVVGGPFVEYSGIRWGIFFLSEYANTFAVAAIAALVFFGGWNWPWPIYPDWFPSTVRPLAALTWFLAKTYGLVLFIIWLRGTLPRLRIDQLMSLAWKLLLPLSFVNLLITAAYRLYDLPGWTLFLVSMAVLVAAGAYLRRRWRPAA